MPRKTLIGSAAGVVATVAFNAATHADISLRGGSACSLPQTAAARTGEKR